MHGTQFIHHESTVYTLLTHFKTTWMYPWSNHWQQDKRDVLVTKVGFMIITLSPFIRKKQSQPPSHRKYDISKLQEPDITATFEFSNQSVDEEWRIICDIATETANTVINFTKTKNQDWFDENNIEIYNLIEAKKNAHLAHEQDQRSRLKKKHF